MLKQYRRNFVVFTMAIIGAVLAAVFVFLGIYMHRRTVNEMKTTMQQVLRPLDEPTGMFRRLGDRRGDKEGEFPDGEGPSAVAPEEGGTVPDGSDMPSPDVDRFDGERPDFFDQTPEDREGSAGIVTVFYSAGTGEISVQNGVDDLSEDVISGAVEKIAASNETYGTLGEYGLYYMREGMGDDFKIALAQTSYVSSRTLRSTLVLALIYLATTAALLILTIHLSKRAAKPMENAIEMERQFVADISHDLKTPITVILANNSILKENKDETVASQSQWIESTDEAAKGMMELISRMLTLSALDAKAPGEERLYEVDLSNVAEKALLQLDSVAYDRGVELKEQIDEGVSVKATKEYAERIVTALVENALKYEKTGGTVEVSLAGGKKRATLTVRNNSSFIAPEDLPHIFERFYRADRSRTEKSGHGLGLPTVKRVTELVGAEISVESTPENGTAFTVIFPTA